MAARDPLPSRRPEVATSPSRTREPRAAADRHLWEITPVRDVLWLAFAFGLLWTMYALRSVFTPVLIALTLAYLSHPLLRHAERTWRLPRPATTILLLFALAVAGGALAAWLGPLVTDQLQTLAKKTPQYIASITARYGVKIGASEHLTALVARLQDNPLSVLQSLFLGTTQAVGVIGQVIGATTDAALFIILIPIYYFFFAWHFDRLLATVWRWWPASRKPRTAAIAARMDEAVSGFFRGRVVIAVLSGILYAVGWAFSGVPYWSLLGALTGLLTIVPYASALGWPLAILLKYLDAVSSGNGEALTFMSILFWPSVPYLAVQFVESWLLTPWIQSQSTDMSALTVLIVVFLGGAIGGIFGLILAIPVAACIKILFQELILPRWERWAAEH